MNDKYYKIPPEWASRLNVTTSARKHPDGWFLCLAPAIMRLPQMVGADAAGVYPSLDDAVRSVGGCVYNTEQALASQRGEQMYMMGGGPEIQENIPDVPEPEIPAAPVDPALDDAEKEVGDVN